MLVSELMRPEPHLVTRDVSVADAAGRLVRLQIRHLPVVDPRGRLEGMVTDHAVFRTGGFVDGDHAWMAFDAGADGLTVADVEVPVEVTAQPDEELGTVLRRWTGSRQDVAVVVDENGHPTGIITEHDVLGFALSVLDPTLRVEHEGSDPVHSIDRDAPASAAIEAMMRHRIRHLVVTEDGRVVGVVSYGDLVADDALRRPELTAMDVVRSLQVRTCPQATPLTEVAALMKRDAIGCVPIVDGLGVARGIVTRRDLLEAAIAGEETDALF